MLKDATLVVSSEVVFYFIFKRDYLGRYLKTLCHGETPKAFLPLPLQTVGPDPPIPGRPITNRASSQSAAVAPTPTKEAFGDRGYFFFLQDACR